MSLLSEFIGLVLENPEFGWVLLLGYLMIELRHPKGRLRKIDKKLTSSIVVIRAIVRVTDGIKEEEVDGYLVSNGMKPEDFVSETENDDGDSESTDRIETESVDSVGGVEMSNFTETSDDVTTEE